jgi:hypothetical protein
MRVSAVGCSRTGGEREEVVIMEEKTITTKRGVYGRVSVTLPLPIKTGMLAWAKRSGMKKAEFLRLALTTGFQELSKGIPGSEEGSEAAQQAART